MIPPHTLHGTWALLSFDFLPLSLPSAAPIAQPLGPSPLGRLVLSPTGYMSALLADPAHLKPVSGRWAVAADDEVAKVARAFTTYCGWYRVYEEAVEGGEVQTRIATRVDVALDPSWVGTEQVRWVDGVRVEGEGDKKRRLLTLRPIGEYVLKDGRRGKGLLVWEKVEGPGGAKL